MNSVMPWERPGSKIDDRHLQRLAVIYIRQVWVHHEGARGARLGEAALGVKAAGLWGVAQRPEVYPGVSVVVQLAQRLGHQCGGNAAAPTVGGQ